MFWSKEQTFDFPDIKNITFYFPLMQTPTHCETETESAYFYIIFWKLHPEILKSISCRV